MSGIDFSGGRQYERELRMQSSILVRDNKGTIPPEINTIVNDVARKEPHL